MMTTRASSTALLVSTLLAGLLVHCSGRNEKRPDFTNDPPEAQAGPDAASSAGEEVFFDGSASTDLDGQVVSYLWNFGDGAEAAGAVVGHTYVDGGTFLVTLTVTDDRDATDSDQLLMTVADPIPVAVATFTSPVHAGEPVAFDASASTAAAAISAWRWSFGDGTTATGEVVNHTYDRSGTFTVRLTVEDIEARSGETVEAIEVFPIDIDGVFDVVSTPPSVACTKYNAIFEDTVLTIAVLDTAGNVTARGNTLHDWTGTLSGTQLSLSASYIAPTGGGCINAPVSATLTATVGAGTFTGSVFAYYDLGAADCQCTANFPITGTRRP